MSEEFIRKDVFDAEIKRIEALIAASEARHEKLNAEIQGEIKNINTRINGVIDSLLIAIDGIKEAQNKTLAMWGIIIAVVMGVIQIGISLWFK